MWFKEWSYWRNKLCLFLLVALSIIFTFVCIEGFSRLYLHINPQVEVVSRWDFRARRPPPYLGADYFNKEFLLESMHCITKLTIPEGKGFFLMGDFRGKYFNINNHLRRTTDQPPTHQKRILLFGGSTLFGQEVPDQYTIASYLQRLVNTLPGLAIQVENFGTISVTSAQQTERLLTTLINPGDIVIFYDGVNDVGYYVDRMMMNGFMPQEKIPGIKIMGGGERLLNVLNIKLRDYSAAIRMLRAFKIRVRPPKMASDNLNEGLLEQQLDYMQERYRKALIEAHYYVQQHSGMFWHFLQPNLFTVYPHTPYEEWLIKNDVLVAHVSETTFPRAYSRLRIVSGEVNRKEGISSFDMSTVLNGRKPGEEFFLDFCHVNHAGNERIARAIFEHVFSSPQVRSRN